MTEAASTVIRDVSGHRGNGRTDPGESQEWL